MEPLFDLSDVARSPDTLKQPELINVRCNDIPFLLPSGVKDDTCSSKQVTRFDYSASRSLTGQAFVVHCQFCK